MILFLYGEDNFRSHEKLMAIKMKHIDASLGDTNLSQLDFSDRDYGFTEVTRQVLAMPFLAKSRLVIIKNLLLSKKTKNIQEQIIKLLLKIPESTILVFYEAGLPDKRSALFRKLAKLKQSQEFKPLESYQLRSWIKKEVEAQGAEIEPVAVDLLIQYCGNDLWKLKNEIDKLTTYNLPFDSTQGRQLATKDIDLLVKPKIEAKIFDLVDAYSEKNQKKAHEALYKLLEKGEAELYIFTMIVRQFRNLLIIKDILESSNFKLRTSNFQIAKQSGLHPYVVQKTAICARNFTLNELKKIYQKLLNYDIKMKTGEIEPSLAMDLLITELCR